MNFENALSDDQHEVGLVVYAQGVMLVVADDLEVIAPRLGIDIKLHVRRRS